jgi:hypothetical protein
MNQLKSPNQGIPTLAVDPTSFVFGNKHEGGLRHQLAIVEKGTIVSPVAGRELLHLRPDGITQVGGWRYSIGALNQMCQILGPGLAHLIFDLSGKYRKPTQPRNEFALSAAVDVFNRTLGLRYARVQERQLVKFLPGKIIDGIVGPKYRYLPNLGFYDRVKEAAGKEAVFHEALLYGRYLALRYVLPKTRFTWNAGTTAESFVLGYHFVNSEVGEGSVRGAVMFVREATGDTCVGPFIGRVKHQGSDFEERLTRLMLTIGGRVEGATDSYLNLVRKLAGESLGLGKDSKTEEATRRGIAATLVKQGLQQNIAERVVMTAVVVGSGDDRGDPLNIDRQRLVLARRTPYDVFTALMREARKLSINAREEIEQIAFALLKGKFTFG